MSLSPQTGALSRFRISSLHVYDERVFLLLLVALALASWPSLSSLLPLAGGDTPLAFVPLVPFVGVALLIWTFDGDAIRASTRDSFLDAIALIVLLASAGFVLILLPTLMSWDYWLDRLDIPGLVILLAALLVAAWGIPALARLWPALLYLLLAWPLPYLLVDHTLLPGITRATAVAARAVAPLLPLSIRAAPHDQYAFLVTYHGHVVHLLIQQACSGVNGGLGIVVISLPVALVARGGLESRLLWLAAGALLSWGVNLLRIVIVAAATAVWGPGLTFSVIHPMFGLVLFVLSFLGLLMIAPWFGLDLSPLYAGTRKRAFVAPAWSWGRLSLLAVIIAGGALIEQNLNQFSWISDRSLPRVQLKRSSDLLHTPRKWKILNSGGISGWKSLFGASTVSSVMTLRGPDDQEVQVQAIMTKDADAFNTYGVEDCYQFHGFTMRSVHRVALGNGVTGTLIDFVAQKESMASLYWLQPVQTPRGLFHERIILLARTSTKKAPTNVPTAPLSANPVQSVADAFAELLSPWVGGNAGPEYDAVNGQLRHLGNGIIAGERTV